MAYCRDEPAAQEFLQMNDGVREYFEVKIKKLKLNFMVLNTNRIESKILIQLKGGKNSS